MDFNAKRLHFPFGQRNRFASGSDKARHAADVADNMPGFVIHDHFHENIAREQFVFRRLSGFAFLSGRFLILGIVITLIGFGGIIFIGISVAFAILIRFLFGID